MLHPRKSSVLIIGGLATAAVLLVGCGSSSSSDSSASASASESKAASPSASKAASESASMSASGSGSASASESAIGGNVLPPVMVDDSATTATAKVGDTIVFAVEDPVGTKISTSDPALLAIEQGYNDGSATFNPGAKALATGTAKVTLIEPNEPERTVTVTIQ